MLEIRESTAADFERIWPIFQAIAAAVDNGDLLGTYYLKTSQAGPGAHVCNYGYMVANAARGRGIATAMCGHSQGVARDLGYETMQFNFVASTNEGAVRL